MYFRESIKAIIKSKMFSLIISIQLVVAFFTLIAGVNMIQGSLNQLTNFRSIFDEGCTIKITYASKTMEDTQLSEKDREIVFQYYDELSKDTNISKIGIMSTGAMNESIQDLESISNGEKSGLSNTIFTDKNFYRYIGDVMLSSGKNFSEEDFNKSEKDIVPIIISEDLKKHLPLGQLFQGKYQVIGVLKNNNKLFYDNNGSLYLGVTQKENTIIIPINYKNKNNRRWVATSFMGNAMITLKNTNLTNQYIKKINSVLATLVPIPLKVTKVIDDKAIFINLIKGGIIATVSISVLLIIYSFFGILGIILTSLIRRKKEFGVKLSFGWTFRDICLQVSSEIFLIVICSYITAMVLSLLLLKNEMYKLSIYTYGFVLLLVLLFTVIYSILPISKIRKMNIVELIKDVR